MSSSLSASVFTRIIASRNCLAYMPVIVVRLDVSNQNISNLKVNFFNNVIYFLAVSGGVDPHTNAYVPLVFKTRVGAGQHHSPIILKKYPYSRIATYSTHC